jgi:hypothetical protein
MTMKTVLISSLLNSLQNHLGADCPMHGITHTSWTPKPDSGQLTDCNPSVPHSVPRRPRMAQGHSGDIRRQSPGVGADAHLWFVGAGMAYRNFSATRQGWSKGIGGCDVSMKLCSSSSRCESCPAKGEPAQAGSKPCAGLGVPGVSGPTGGSVK